MIFSDEMKKRLSPEESQDDFTKRLLDPGFGFTVAKKLDDGTYVGISRLAFTYAIHIGIDEERSFRRRYCYSDMNSLLGAYADLKTGNDVPEGWIARRPKPASDDEFCP